MLHYQYNKTSEVLMKWNMDSLLNKTGTTPIPDVVNDILSLDKFIKMKTGDEVQVSQRELAQGKGRIKINGINSVVYIKNDYTGTQRWHFYKCSALKSHQSFDKRYVLKTDSIGCFYLERQLHKALEPCQKCLMQSKMDKEWNSLVGTLEQRNSIFIPIVANLEFYENVDSCFSHPNQVEDHELQGYVREWRGISFNYRRLKKWTCEDCGINLKNHKHLLHTHHIDRNKTNNSHENFKALCVPCHANQPFHYERMIDKFRKEIEFVEVLKKNKKS